MRLGLRVSRGKVRYADDGTPTPTPPPVDNTPDQFTFTDVTDAEPSTQYTSNTITVSGMDTGASAGVTVAGATYSKNGGAYTSSIGTAQNGDTFNVRHTSSADYSTPISTTLTIGSVSDTFTTTTVAAPAEAANIVATPSSPSIAEDAAVGTIVATLSVENGSGTYEWLLTDGGEPSSSALTLHDIGDNEAELRVFNIDFEAFPSLSITGLADTGVDTPVPFALTVSVTDADEAEGFAPILIAMGVI